MTFTYTGETKTETNISQIASNYLDSKVKFSFKFATTHKKFCLSKSKQIKIDLDGTYNAISHREKFTWRDFLKGKKNKGIEKEKKDSYNYKLLKEICPTLDHFGHFYIDKCSSGVGRIFGGYAEDIFYIIFFDINGQVNSKAHK